jgi:hypothetical protein
MDLINLLKMGLEPFSEMLCVPKRSLEETRYAVAQVVEALHYKPEGRGFDS